MKTGFSLMEILHREIAVLITGMGLQCRAYCPDVYMYCVAQQRKRCRLGKNTKYHNSTLRGTEFLDSCFKIKIERRVHY